MVIVFQIKSLLPVSLYTHLTYITEQIQLPHCTSVIFIILNPLFPVSLYTYLTGMREQIQLPHCTIVKAIILNGPMDPIYLYPSGKAQPTAIST